MRKLTYDDLEWEIRVHAEDQPVVGNVCSSGNPKIDAQVEERIQKRLDAGDQWAWCQVELVGTFAGMEVTDWLSEVSCLDEQDFRAGGYYDDMRESVLESMQRWLNNLEQLLQKDVGHATADVD